MERDCGDILDRAAIARLKSERIRDLENIKEWEAFRVEVDILKTKYLEIPIDMFFKLLYDINSTIWEKESDLRQGKLDGVIYEVGLRAIEIRKLNGIRVGIKNIINTMTKTGWIDIKSNHISE